MQVQFINWSILTYYGKKEKKALIMSFDDQYGAECNCIGEHVSGYKRYSVLQIELLLKLRNPYISSL